MDDPKEVLTTCVSTPELERRWKAVRKMMVERKIDYLVIQNSEEFMGGTVRWFTDFSARDQFPYTVIFPVDDEMTTISCGGDPPSPQFPPPWAARGIKNRLGGCYFSTIPYTNTLEAELALSVLKEKKKPTIGWVEKAFIPLSFYETIVKELPGAKYVDASEWVDEIKVPKSAEEIELSKKTAALQDQAVEHLKKTIKPGMREYEVLAEAQYACVRGGSERQLIMLASGPGVTTNHFRHFQNRMIKEGDQIFILIETNGPGGYYTEIMKSFVVGKKPSQELQDVHGVSVEAQAMTVSRLKDGADPKELWDLTNGFLQKKGYPPNTRLYSHGQGLSLVERPLIRYNETWKLKAGMNITVHPRVAGKTTFDSVCENWIVGKEGPSPCLHKTPREIIVIE